MDSSYFEPLDYSNFGLFNLEFSGGSQKIRIDLPQFSEHSEKKYDITSISIPSNFVDQIYFLHIKVGGFSILRFNRDMLLKIPTINDQKQLLRPFLSRLPLSRLWNHESYIVFEAIPEKKLSGSIIKLIKTPSFNTDNIIPMMEPHPHMFDDEQCISTDKGLYIAPNGFQTGSGMGALLRVYDSKL